MTKISFEFKQREGTSPFINMTQGIYMDLWIHIDDDTYHKIVFLTEKNSKEIQVFHLVKMLEEITKDIKHSKPEAKMILGDDKAEPYGITKI